MLVVSYYAKISKSSLYFLLFFTSGGYILMNIPLWHYKRFWIGTTLLLLLALMLAACSGTNGNSGPTPTAHGTTTGSGTTPTTTPRIRICSQPCPAPVKAPAYRHPIIP